MAKRIVTVITAIIFLAFTAFAIFYYFGTSYTKFYEKARAEFNISGLDDGFTPQGLTSFEGTFLMSGYMKNSSPSRIYVIKDNQTVKYFTLYSTEGGTKKAYDGHCGGIATNGTSCWVVGDNSVACFNFEDIDGVLNGGEIEIKSEFESPNGADFVTIYENYLWVGEFYRSGKYDTDESHFIEVSEKRTNPAVAFCYEINDINKYGLASLNPVMALSTTSLVQGMVITDDKIMLSTSYSLPDSHIYTYDNIIKTGTAVKKLFTGLTEEVDTYILEEPKEELTLPCMSEEMTIHDGRVYVIFENACQKYKMFTKDNLKTAYSFEI